MQLKFEVSMIKALLHSANPPSSDSPVSYSYQSNCFIFQYKIFIQMAHVFFTYLLIAIQVCFDAIAYVSLLLPQASILSRLEAWGGEAGN